jgi:predicted nucleic acid-binding protein
VGLILDSSVLIAAERSKEPISFLLTRIAATRPQRIMISAVSVVELEHGFWRAQTPEQSNRRRIYLDEPPRSTLRNGEPGK